MIYLLPLAFVAGGIFALFALVFRAASRRGRLAPWHTVLLAEEFTADCGDIDLVDYLAREERLFAELEERVYGGASMEMDPDIIHRFRKGSPADPTSFPTNWNRSFELVPEGGPPRRGVLLLHGMSDSPYSLRALGERLRAEGALVLGLRLPGHGTAPSGLLTVHRRDLEAAVELAMKSFRRRVGDGPLFQIGYSNGGALAVRYAIEALENPALPRAERIVLISPAIGVNPLVGLAVWIGRIGHWLGVHNLEWTSIASEYDPCKYNSFAVNAGDQVRRLTVEIGRELERVGRGRALEEFPPVLAFQSAVDATVSTPALIAGLFSKLPGDRHELVLFDLNRTGRIEDFLIEDPKGPLTELVLSSGQPFAVTVLANRGDERPDLEERSYSGDRSECLVRDPGLVWPEGIYSLSHVSLPFPPDDPLYGIAPGPGRDEPFEFHLGQVALRGEKGVFRVPAADQLRLRWNPFYSWLENRVAIFVSEGSQRDNHPDR